MLTYLTVAALIAGLAAIAALILSALARDSDAVTGERWVTVEEYEAEHQGADESYYDQLLDMNDATAEMPAFADEAPRRGRHHEDTVEMVAADWQPPVGARRIALLTDTQYDLQPVDA